MKRSMFPAIAFFLCLFSVYAQTDPLITSWNVNVSGAKGYMGYTTNVKQVLYSSNSVYIRTNDLADYIPENAGNGAGQVDWWPNNPWFPDSMGFTFRFRRNPVQNTGAPKKPPYGHIGVWRNGVSIYNPLDAKSYNSLNTWFQNAYYWEHIFMETFDPCWGHPNNMREYHTHQSPSCVYDQTDSLNHSPIIGFAFDGFPVYGCYGYANPDGSGPIRRMKSSYRLRNIQDRTTLPDGTVLSPNLYGPSLAAVPLGGYQEDYEYVSGLGDLDDHNGRFCVTPEFPDGTFAYFVTLDDNLVPVYPYVVGQTFYGVIYPQDGNMGPNSGYVVINEAVTEYIPSLTASEETEIRTEFEAFPNPASDQVNFIIRSNDYHTVYKGEIFNQSGVLVTGGDMQTNRNYAYNTSDLAPGLYILRISGNGRVFTKKFLISR